MVRIFICVLLFFSSVAALGQGVGDNRQILLQDSTQLRDFWINLKWAVRHKDKSKMASLCSFPFSCRPCLDDTSLHPDGQNRVEVTEQLFSESQYKIFFSKPIEDLLRDHQDFDIAIFVPYYDQYDRLKGAVLPYTIIAPSKTWEGSQGYIFLEKTEGRFKISAVDTVP